MSAAMEDISKTNKPITAMRESAFKATGSSHKQWLWNDVQRQRDEQMLEYNDDSIDHLHHDREFQRSGPFYPEHWHCLPGYATPTELS